MSEDALSRIEAALRAQEKKHIPRAGQLPPVSGLPAVEEVSLSNAHPPTLSFQLSPPLAPERLQSINAEKRPYFNTQILSVALIVGAMLAALAYHLFTTEMSAEPAIAKVVASDPVPSPPPQAIEVQVIHPTPMEASNQLDTNPDDGPPPQSPIPAETPVSIAPVLARSVPIESTANTVVSSPIHHSGAGRHASGARSKSQ
jgi:hypothetical protein